MQSNWVTPFVPMSQMWNVDQVAKDTLTWFIFLDKTVQNSNYDMTIQPMERCLVLSKVIPICMVFDGSLTSTFPFSISSIGLTAPPPKKRVLFRYSFLVHSFVQMLITAQLFCK